MAISKEDFEEYMVRKAVDAGVSEPTIIDVSRVRAFIPDDEASITEYLEEQRGFESQEDYDNIMALIDAIKSEVSI